MHVISKRLFPTQVTFTASPLLITLKTLARLKYDHVA